MGRLKLAVLISGRGSNLQALIDACADPSYPAEIVLVISNQASAQGLARAEAAGLATTVIDHSSYDGREAFDSVVTAAIEGAGAELVCLAGFMRLLSDEFVGHWRNHLINIHPSLLPAYRGLDVHQRVLDAGETQSGCTVHFVRAETDTGPIILQTQVPVRPGDDEGSLAARILEREHRIYPEAVRLIADGRVNIDGLED